MSIVAALWLRGHYSSMDVQFDPIETADGTITFWHPGWHEHYHSRAGALAEANAKFVVPARVRERLLTRDLALLDVCFGLGYNALAACATAERLGRGFLTVTALEVDRAVVAAAADHAPRRLAGLDCWRGCLKALACDGHCEGEHFSIDMVWGDARRSLQALMGPYDVVFHDPFSSQRCAELWTVDFFALVRSRMDVAGELFTYSEALAVRSSMLAAGFCIGVTLPSGSQRGGTVGALLPRSLGHPLPIAAFEAECASPRGEPYRDPHLQWDNSAVLSDRERRMRLRHAH